MRKNIIITALALMGAIAFTSCVREEFETPGEAQKDNTVNFTINTGSAEVKSYMEYDEEAGKYVPNWHKGDALAAYLSVQMALRPRLRLQTRMRMALRLHSPVRQHLRLETMICMQFARPVRTSM